MFWPFRKSADTFWLFLTGVESWTIIFLNIPTPPQLASWWCLWLFYFPYVFLSPSVVEAAAQAWPQTTPNARNGVESCVTCSAHGLSSAWTIWDGIGGIFWQCFCNALRLSALPVPILNHVSTVCFVGHVRSCRCPGALASCFFRLFVRF